MVKVAIVDDHKIFREGVKLILENEPDIEIISESQNGKEFIENINNIDADVVLMDINMPEMDGIETTKQVTNIKPDLKILALSMYGDEEYYYKMIHAGVKGFLIKEAKSDELKEAIMKVNSGNNFFSQELLRKVLFNFNNTIDENNKAIKSFSKDELELFKFICQGLTDIEIAKIKKVNVSVVKKQHNDLLDKTNTNDTANLIMYAIQNEIVII